MQDQRERLREIRDDPNQHPEIRKAAERRLNQRVRPTIHQRHNVARYRVGGVWKLTERVADFDREGDVVNGYSDRT